MKFSDLPLDERLQRAIAEANYTLPTPIQEKAIPPILARNDLMGIAQTGTGKTAAFAGNSGVGKSSLLNALLPGFGAETGTISDRIGRGRHTTRHVELVPYNGGYIADTPGFSSFDTEQMDLVLREALQYAFREFAPYLTECRFTGCAHVKEKGCAVLAAVEAGKIAQSRHDSYVKLYESVKDLKEWQLGKELKR